MRRFLTLAVLIVSLQPLISQNLNIAAHEGIDIIYSLILINSKSYFQIRKCPVRVQEFVFYNNYF